MRKPYHLSIPAALAAALISMPCFGAGSPADEEGLDDILIEEGPPSKTEQPAPTPAPPAPAPVTPQSASSTVKQQPAAAPAQPVNPDLEEQRDLLFEAGEDAPVAEKKPAPAKPAAKPDSLAPHGATPAVVEEEGELIEEQGAAADSLAPPTRAVVKRDAAVVKESLAAARVADERSIDFAEGLKEYRSPRLAMLLSLIVPGLGQAYAKRYWKTGVFLAVEAAAIATSVGFLRRGNRFREQAYEHADSAWSYDSLRAYHGELWNGIYQSAESPTKEYADSIMRWEIFGIYDSNLVDTAYFRTEYYDKRRDREDFYQWLQDDMFVQGWKDAKPKLTSDMVWSGQSQLSYSGGDSLIYTTPATAANLNYKFNLYRLTGGDTVLVDGGERRYGFSHYYDVYNALLEDRNRNQRVAGAMIYVVIVNHIVSAIDAGISAKVHNDRLLGRRSMWERIGIEERFVDTGTHTVPGITLTLSF